MAAPLSTKLYYYKHREDDLNFHHPLLHSYWNEAPRFCSQEYVGSRILLKLVLDRLGIEQSLGFYREPFKEDRFHCSLSHTKGISLISVSQNQKLGVDIELKNRELSEEIKKRIGEHESYSELQQWVIAEAVYKSCDPRPGAFSKIQVFQNHYEWCGQEGFFQVGDLNSYFWALASGEVFEGIQVEELHRS